MDKKKIFIGIGVVTFVIFAVVYLGIAVYYQYHFLPGTEINGKDYSNKTVDDVKDELLGNIRKYYLKVIERGGEVEHISAKDFDLNISIDGDIKKIKEGQNHYLWFLGTDEKSKLKVTISYDDVKLDYAINNLKCLNDDYIHSGIAPELKFDGNEFTMTEGTPGNEIDKEKTIQQIKNAVANMDQVINLETKECYIEKIDENASDKFKETLDKLNSYLDVTITLTFGDETEIINRGQIYKWLSVDAGNNILIDKDAIVEYIESFATKYETMGQSREFMTSLGEKITVRGGDYGWWINKKAEAEAIVEDITSLNSCTREPKYQQRAAAMGENDIGDTYIEVNLTTQHLFAYKEGEKIVDCDIISGDPINGKATPMGLYNMRFMFTNYDYVRGSFRKTLKYWMVFYGNSVETNIGIASCNWISTFGGNAYKGAGSLGSIYINEADAKTLYMQLPGKDFPVIIYK